MRIKDAGRLAKVSRWKRDLQNPGFPWGCFEKTGSVSQAASAREKRTKKGQRGRCAPTATLISLHFHYGIEQEGGKAIRYFGFEKALII
jgi:hypothetical protein